MNGNINMINIKDYIYENYNFYPQNNISQKYISNIIALLQNNYGEENDCTITSITAIIKYFKPNLQPIEIYNVVEQIAKKYFYSGEKGTFPLWINNILQKSLNTFNITQKAHSAYLKNICYNFNKIKNIINTNMPILLNMNNDGRDFYKNHTVLIIGYYEINNVKMLAIYDNWYNQISYIDYNKLSIISSINYLT